MSRRLSAVPTTRKPVRGRPGNTNSLSDRSKGFKMRTASGGSGVV
jgi:hypothetical protein